MKYCAELVETLCKHLKGGSTIQSACAAVGISKQTFYQWKETKLDFSDAIKKAMAVPDREVEDALYKSAIMGHSYKETEFKAVAVGEKIKHIPVKKTEKIIPPSVTAQIFWLKNRCPEEFKDRHDLDISGDLSITVKRIITDERPPE